METVEIVGVHRDGRPVEVAILDRENGVAAVLADLHEFWADPVRHLSTGRDGTSVPINDARLVPPVLPQARVICVGLNYAEHVAEGSYRESGVPEHPTLFARWATTLTVDGEAVPVPGNEEGLDWEGEVVAWVGATLVDVDPDQALASVVGYSVFNDLTARRAQKLTSQWTLGKNADKSGPIGPLVPAAEVGDLRQGLRLETRVNGKLAQQGRTDDMVHDVGSLLSHISHSLTLRSGDLLATGTPAGVGYSRTPPWLLTPGDVVSVTVERLGTVTNMITANSSRHADWGKARNQEGNR